MHRGMGSYAHTAARSALDIRYEVEQSGSLQQGPPVQPATGGVRVPSMQPAGRLPAHIGTEVPPVALDVSPSAQLLKELSVVLHPAVEVGTAEQVTVPLKPAHLAGGGGSS